MNVSSQVKLGVNVTLTGRVDFQGSATLEDNVVLGKQTSVSNGLPICVASDVTLCCGAVIYAGVEIGSATIIGDQVEIHEQVTIGANAVIGRGSIIGKGTKIGQGVRVQTNVFLPPNTVVEDNVFIGPGVTASGVETLDNGALGKAGKLSSTINHRFSFENIRNKGKILPAPMLRRACRVGGGVTLAAVEVGEEAFIGAGAVVVEDVLPRTLVIGVPARFARNVTVSELYEKWR